MLSELGRELNFCLPPGWSGAHVTCGGQEVTPRLRNATFGRYSLPTTVEEEYVLRSTPMGTLKTDDSAVAATVEVNASHVIGTIAAIHNLTEGPVTQSNWLVDTTRPDKSTKDYSAGFLRAGVQRSRTHGVGCIDMELLWRPFPVYKGQDASLASNYNWTIVDECVRGWYFNQELGGAKVEMFVRFGHSHANRTSHPYFSTPPDDFDVFGAVCLHIVRHLLTGWDSGYRLGIRDFTVWNEPSSTLNLDSTCCCCPFWVGTARQYAQLYSATYRAIKPVFGDSVRIGAAVNSALSQHDCHHNGRKGTDHCFDWNILGNISQLAVPIDFVEFHWYGKQPVQLTWNLIGRGAGAPPNTGGALSLEDSLVAADFPRSTPVLLGEWSRFIPAYAMDGPGAAFLACCLMSLNGMHPSNGPHFVEDSFVFAAGKIWKGFTEGAPNEHAGVLWEVWQDLHAKTPRLLNTSLILGQPWSVSSDNDAAAWLGPSSCCEFHAVSGSNGVDAVTLLLASYNSTTEPGDRVPSVGATHTVAIRVDRLPWSGETHWQQYAQANGEGESPRMRLVREGQTGSNAFDQQLTFNTNTFSVVKLVRVKTDDTAVTGTVRKV